LVQRSISSETIWSHERTFQPVVASEVQKIKAEMTCLAPEGLGWFKVSDNIKVFGYDAPFL